MVRSGGSPVLSYAPAGGNPASRREDVRAILRQQITTTAAWALAYYAVRGRTAQWVDQYVMTPQIQALVPQGRDTAVVQGRWSAAGELVEYGEVGFYVGRKLAITRPVVMAVAKFVTKIITKYIGGFTVGTALAGTGFASWAGALIDGGFFLWTVWDIWNAREELIDGIVSTWFD